MSEIPLCPECETTCHMRQTIEPTGRQVVCTRCGFRARATGQRDAEQRLKQLRDDAHQVRIYAGERLPAREGLVLANMLEKALKESER